jgi:translation initiation factor 2 alpha subunit (eIF-2alpha)
MEEKHTAAERTFNEMVFDCGNSTCGRNTDRYIYDSLTSQLSSAIESYNRECKRNDLLQEEVDKLKELVKEMFELTKCGYAHNYGSPNDRKLEMLAEAKSILDDKEVTPKDIENWLH